MNASEEAAPTGRVPASLLAMLDQVDADSLQRLYKVLAVTLKPPPKPRQKHEDELGALHAMLMAAGVVESGQPRIPRRRYDAERPGGAPKSARLVERYGSWFKACRAAAGLNVPAGTEGAPRPWSAPQRTQGRGPRFTREEVIEAVVQCAAAAGRVPSSNVYYAWSAKQRKSARHRGATLPRLPAQRSVERHFRCWGEVRAAVQDRLAANAQPARPGELADGDRG